MTFVNSPLFWITVVSVLVVGAALIGFAFPVWYGLGKNKNDDKCNLTRYYYYGQDPNKCTAYEGKCADNYYYPVFKNLADAQTADKCDGGSGTAHEHKFSNCDESFFMPDSSKNHDMGYLPSPNPYQEATCAEKKSAAPMDTY